MSTNVKNQVHSSEGEDLGNETPAASPMDSTPATPNPDIPHVGLEYSPSKPIPGAKQTHPEYTVEKPLYIPGSNQKREQDGKLAGNPQKQEIIDYALGMLKNQATNPEVRIALRKRFNLTIAQSGFWLKQAYDEIAVDITPKEIAYARNKIAMGVAWHYQEATRAADMASIADTLKDPNIDQRIKLALLSKFDPERSRANALKCLDQLARLFGLNAPEKHQVTLEHDIKSLTPKQRQARITELLQKRSEADASGLLAEVLEGVPDDEPEE